MHKILIFLMCIILSIYPSLSVYADMGGGGAGFGDFDWKTAEFIFNVDNIRFHHHSDGTCDVLNADDSVNYTMTKEETENKIKSLKITFDKYGNATMTKSCADMIREGIAAALCTFGDWTKTTSYTDGLEESILRYNVNDFGISYFTNTFADGVTVDSSGNINLTSDKVDEIIKLMKKQYREYVGLYEAADFTHDGSKNDIISFIVNHGIFGLSNLQVNHVLDWFESSGYDSIYFGIVDNPYNVSGVGMEIWGFNTSAYSYAYSKDKNALYVDENLDGIDKTNNPVGGYISIGKITAGNINNLESIFNTNIDIFSYLGEYNLLNYDREPWYWKFYHLKGTSNFKYYSSFEKMLNHVNGGVSESFYYSNDFNVGAHPDGITLTVDMLGEDWEKHNRDIVDAIEKGIENVTDEAERQHIIDEIITKRLKDINDNISDLTDTLEEANKKTNTLLRSILSAIYDFNNSFNAYINSINLDILNDIKISIDALTSVVKDISSVRTIQDIDVVINNLTDVDINEFKTSVSNDFSRCSDAFKTKFPTCAVFDMYVIANMLTAPPEAPVLTYNLKIDSFGLSFPLVFDFSVLDNYIHYLRGAQVILFIFSLMKVTIKLFLGGNGGVV